MYPGGAASRLAAHVPATRDSATVLFRATYRSGCTPLAHAATRARDLPWVLANTRLVEKTRGMLATMLFHLGDRPAADLAFRPTQFRFAVVSLARHLSLSVGASRLFERQIRSAVARATWLFRVPPRRPLFRDVGRALLRGSPVEVTCDACVAPWQDSKLGDSRRRLIKGQREVVTRTHVQRARKAVRQCELVPVSQNREDFYRHGPPTLAEIRIIVDSQINANTPARTVPQRLRSDWRSLLVPHNVLENIVRATSTFWLLFLFLLLRFLPNGRPAGSARPTCSCCCCSPTRCSWR